CRSGDRAVSRVSGVGDGAGDDLGVVCAAYLEAVCRGRRRAAQAGGSCPLAQRAPPAGCPRVHVACAGRTRLAPLHRLLVPSPRRRRDGGVFVGEGGGAPRDFVTVVDPFYYGAGWSP